MASATTTYVPSLDNPGKVFRFTFYKPAGRPAVVTASEGTLTKEDGYSWFTNMPFSDRRYRLELSGRATKKAIAAATATLVASMVEKGLIAAGAEVAVE